MREARYSVFETLTRTRVTLRVHTIQPVANQVDDELVAVVRAVNLASASSWAASRRYREEIIDDDDDDVHRDEIGGRDE